MSVAPPSQADKRRLSVAPALFLLYAGGVAEGGHAQLASSSRREQTWRGREASALRKQDETRECAAVNTWTRTRRRSFLVFSQSCLSERLPTSSREPGSGRCLAPTAGPALLTVDKQVGPGVGESERTTGRLWWCTPPRPPAPRRQTLEEELSLTSSV